VAKLSDTLAQFAVARNWLSADRAARIASEARERSTVNIGRPQTATTSVAWCGICALAASSPPGLSCARCCRQSRIVRAALAELSDLPQARVAALLHDRGGASLQALLIRAGLPESTFAAFGWRSKPIMKPDMSTRSVVLPDCGAGWSNAC